jgi:hypothetical protein
MQLIGEIQHLHGWLGYVMTCCRKSSDYPFNDALRAIMRLN